MTNEIRFKFSANGVLIPMVDRILKEGLEEWGEVFYRNEKPRGSYGSLVDVSMGFKSTHLLREDLGVVLTSEEYQAAVDLINDAEGEGL
jgi:hypothetical protein